MGVAKAASFLMNVLDHGSLAAVSWIDVRGHWFATRIATRETIAKSSENVRRSDKSDRSDRSDRNEPSDRSVAVQKAAIDGHAVAIVTHEIGTAIVVIATAIAIVTAVVVHARGKDPDGKH